jgi:hypothetical protein
METSRGGKMLFRLPEVAAMNALCLLILVLCGCSGPKAPKALFLVNQDRKFGYMDRSGCYVIPPKLSWAGNFSDGLAPAETESTPVGYINSTGAFSIAPRFDLANEFSEGLAMVLITNEDGRQKAGFIDTAGRFRIAPKFVYELGAMFSEGLAAVKLETSGKYVFIDKNGDVVLQPQADRVSAFKQGLAAASRDDKTGYIDKSGHWVIPPQFEFAGDFSEGLAPVAHLRHQWGYIDLTGKLVIPPSYTVAKSFTEGLAAVSNDISLFGFIDRTGKLVISYQFDRAHAFHAGIAQVEGIPGAGLINRTGRYIAGPYLARALLN